MNPKDPLDKIFVDYHKTIVKDKFGQWEFKKIDTEFIGWFNSWAELMRNDNYKKKSPEFREGYQECIRDIYKKLRLNRRHFDKRTKTGFSKND